MATTAAGAGELTGVDEVVVVVVVVPLVCVPSVALAEPKLSPPPQAASMKLARRDNGRAGRGAGVMGWRMGRTLAAGSRQPCEQRCRM